MGHFDEGDPAEEMRRDREVAQLQADLAAAHSEIERLKAGLRRYGLHDMECAQEDWRFAKATCPTFNEPMPDCGCGLDALLKESKS